MATAQEALEYFQAKGKIATIFFLLRNGYNITQAENIVGEFVRERMELTENVLEVA